MANPTAAMIPSGGKFGYPATSDPTFDSVTHAPAAGLGTVAAADVVGLSTAVDARIALASVTTGQVTGLTAAIDAEIAVKNVVPIIDKTANFTLAQNEANSHYTCEKGSLQTVTVPLNATVPITVGSLYDGAQYGSQVTFVLENAGLQTLVAADNKVTTRTVGSAFQLIKVGTNTWLLTGDLV